MEKPLAAILSAYQPNRKDLLIPMLQKIQDEYGYLPEEAVSSIARHLGIPSSRVYSAATFYNQFTMKPRGRYHIFCCDGVSCHLEDSSGLLSELNRLLGIGNGETSQDGMFSLEVVPCLGLCHIAPAITVNGKIFGNLHRSGVAKLIDQIRTGKHD
jgi:NADH-quinone oxidoreductase subunit E